MQLTRRTFVRTVAAATLGASLSRVAHAEQPKIKVGQIGVGHAHASKLGVYRRSPDYEVVGVFEPDESLRATAAKSAVYEGVTWLKSEEQLLATPGLQAVLVETKVRDLLATAQRCVDAGLHVHLDKPAGESLPDYRRLLDAAAKRKLLVQMGYMYRYSPAVILLRRFLREGWLGEVFEVHTVMSKVVDDSSRRGLAEYRGGIMFELGCHVIDLVIGVLGRPDAVRPYSRRSAPRDDGLVDNMLAVLEYSKALATIKTAALEVEGGSRRHLVVCGQGGTFHIQPLDAPRVTYSLDRDRGEYKKGTHEVGFDKFERYIADAADMARILRGEKECDFPYAHDLAVQETVLLASGVPIK